MEFIIRCTSGREVVDGVYEKEFTQIDERTVNDPKKLPHPSNINWYENGSNHRVENGHIKRDFQRTERFITIPDLPALLEFIAKHGRIVIEQAWQNPDILQLEIYDDYRE